MVFAIITVDEVDPRLEIEFWPCLFIIMGALFCCYNNSSLFSCFFPLTLWTRKW